MNILQRHFLSRISCTTSLVKPDGKEEVSLSLIGGSLKKMMPKFKVKRYGCKTLGKLYERLERYELVMTEKGVASAVRMKGRTVRQE